MLLETKDLKKRFAKIKAVDGVDIAIGEDENIVGLIGPNGAGKTTFYNLVTGIIETDSGEVLYRDENIEGMPPDGVFDKGIARTWQTPRIFNSLTVLENLTLVPKNIYQNPVRVVITPMSKIEDREEELKEKAYGILEEVGLYDKRDQISAELNIGEKKTLELARVLMADPDLILADEPTAGLGNESTKEIKDYMVNISEERNTNIVIVEHKMSVVMDISERVIVLEKGKVLASGTPKKIRENDEVRRVYLGEGRG